MPTSKSSMEAQPFCLLDEIALKETLEGIPCPDEYYEVVYLPELGLPDTFSLKLFPAIRTIIKTPSFAIARVYIGADRASDDQIRTMVTALQSQWIVSFKREWPKDEEEAE